MGKGRQRKAVPPEGAATIVRNPTVAAIAVNKANANMPLIPGEAAELMGVTRTRARQLEAVALRRLRARLGSFEAVNEGE